MAKTKKSSSQKKKKPSSKPKKRLEAKIREALPGEETPTAAPGVGRTSKGRATPPGAVHRNPLIPGTVFARNNELVRWRLVDATGHHLGRLSSRLAHMLMGKDKAGYTRFSDTGDHVIVINAKQVLLTGNKWRDKVYQYHTNYPGGLKTFTARDLLERHPERLIEWAVYGMLPKGHMGRRWYRKLRVYVGSEHPHAAQQPEVVTLTGLGPMERV